MVLMAEATRLAGGADTSAAPRPSEGNGARPLSIGAPSATASAGPAGAAAGAAGLATGAGAAASLDALRLPNTDWHSQPYLWLLRLVSRAMSGISRLPRARLASERPVSTCAN